MTYVTSRNTVKAIKERYQNVVFIEGDILELKMLLFVLRTYHVEKVVHLAAETHVDVSFGESLRHTRTNVLGTHTLLEACRQYNESHPMQLQLIYHQSTDELMGHRGPDDEPFDSDVHIPKPTNPYSASKMGAEAVCFGYMQSFKLPIVISRMNNLAGNGTITGQYVEKLIPKFIHRVMRGMTLSVHGTGEQLRSFLNVKDAARSVLLLLDKGQVGQIYDVGVGEEHTVLEVAKRINEEMKALGWDTAEIEHVRDRAFGDFRYPLVTEKIRGLGWEPMVSFEDSIRECVEFHTQHPDWWGEHIQSSLQAHPGDT